MLVRKRNQAGIAQLPELLMALCFCAPMSLAQSYPPPFPRDAAKKVLDNDRVAVWDVTWPKDRPTQIHEHRFDQLSVTLVGGTVRVTRLVETPVVNQSELGSVTLTRKGTVHTEEGLSEVPQRKIMVEVKGPAAARLNARGPEGVPLEGAVKVTENERATIWDYTWKPQQKTRSGDHGDLVIVFLDGGTIRTTEDRGGTQDTVRKTGEVVYLSGSGKAHTEEAVRGSPRAVIIDLK